MARPRVTIGRVMLATVVLACNLAALRGPLAAGAVGDHRFRMYLIVAVLPALNWLLISLGWRLLRRAPIGPGAVACQLAGWAVLAAVATAAAIDLDLIFDPLEFAFSPVAAYLPGVGVGGGRINWGAPAWRPVVLHAYVALAVSGPIVLLSWLAGRFAARYRVEVRVYRRDREGVRLDAGPAPVAPT